MFIPPLCITCGYPIGDIAELFEYLMKKKHTNHTNRSDHANHTSHTELNNTDIFDQLQIRNSCCRVSLSMAVQFHNYYQ